MKVEKLQNVDPPFLSIELTRSEAEKLQAVLGRIKHNNTIRETTAELFHALGEHLDFPSPFDKLIREDMYLVSQ